MSAMDHQPATPEAPVPFRNLLKRLRIEADHTQESLAEAASVSARLISDLERGTVQRPRRETVRLLCDALGLTGSERDDFVAVARGQKHLPPPTPPTPALRLSALPVPPTPIVGRIKDRATAVTLLVQSDVRCLTLLGPGGVGKTRLAIDVGGEVASRYQDGVAFVDLAPLQDPALVVSAISSAVGVSEAGETPLFDRLIGALSDRQLLLLLDNIEHVTAAAPQIASLLAACTRLTVLITGRAPLKIRAERELRIGPLSMPDEGRLPDLEELQRVPSIELFVQRAEAANRSFALTAENAEDIAEIARRLEGLPLAIELAAARVKVLTPAALLARLSARLPLLTDGLRDLPPRHHAIRAAIAWSYDLLQPREKVLFEQLSIFAGGCPLDGIETVAAGNQTRDPHSGASYDMLETISALVDQSLIHRIPDDGISPRFGMLETIREFGRERLDSSGADLTTARAHASWVLDLVRRAEPELTGPDQEVWFGRLSREIANIRAAFTWSLGAEDAEIALKLCGSLYRFWATSGRYEEGDRWIAAALALPHATAPDLRGNALLGAGVMAYFRGDYTAAERDWLEALEAFEAIGDRRGIGYSYGNLGLVADAVLDYDRAIASYERALAEFRALNDETFIGFMLNNLGLIHYFRGNFDEAADLYAEALGIARRRKSADSIAYVLGNAGLVEFARENYAVATELQTEALTIRRGLTNPAALARCLENFALLAAAQHQPERAIRLFAAANHERERIGITLPPNDAEVNDRYINQAKAQLGDSRFEYYWVTGEDLDIGDAIDLALEPSFSLPSTPTSVPAHSGHAD